MLRYDSPALFIPRGQGFFVPYQGPRRPVSEHVMLIAHLPPKWCEGYLDHSRGSWVLTMPEVSKPSQTSPKTKKKPSGPLTISLSNNN
jgi:hypothetical protein